MIDLEVERLRRLRASALRVRAVARALADVSRTAEKTRSVETGVVEQGDVFLSTAGCAAWRIARAVSGHLRAHPYAPFQKDADFTVILGNSVVAKAVGMLTGSRTQALQVLQMRVAGLLRTLDDARALTWAPDLSDSLGRSQSELRALLFKIRFELHQPATVIPVAVRILPQQALKSTAEARCMATPEAGDWPYLAIKPHLV